jgi:thioredoxin reductase
MSAQAAELGIDHVVVGEPMSFWKAHMPVGMILRSGCDWHLDPAERDTIARFLDERGLRPADAEPLCLDLYLEYADWFSHRRGIRPWPLRVESLDRDDGRLVATLSDGSALTADRVLLATGFAPFAHVPSELAALVPAPHRSHTCDLARPERFRGRRLLIVGGRQSAFESAALLAEAGAAAVHVSHRHDTPSFTASDWSWVGPLLERLADEPGWFRALPAAERDALGARFWGEGRLKLEPWLGPRVRHPAVSIHPRTNLVGCRSDGDALRVRLDSGDAFDVDHVLFATGYKVDLARVALLATGGLLQSIECRDGFPVLDDTLQTSVPGLFMTSLPATRDFGIFFAFTAAVRTSARIVARALEPAPSQ